MTSLEFDTLKNCRLCYIHTVIIRVPFLFLFISCNHTGTNVLSYVNMACASLRNSIPKSVVHGQVREAKRSLLDRFFTELGTKEVTIPTYPTLSFTLFYRNKTLFQVLSITFFFLLQSRHLAKLLDEDPAIMQRRTNLAKRLELYRNAQAEIDAVAWSK